MPLNQQEQFQTIYHCVTAVRRCLLRQFENRFEWWKQFWGIGEKKYRNDANEINVQFPITMKCACVARNTILLQSRSTRKFWLKSEDSLATGTMTIKMFVSFEVADIHERQDQRNINDDEAQVFDSHTCGCSALLARRRLEKTTTQT